MSELWWRFRAAVAITPRGWLHAKCRAAYYRNRRDGSFARLQETYRTYRAISWNCACRTRL